jgi:hypothetical protein
MHRLLTLGILGMFTFFNLTLFIVIRANTTNFIDRSLINDTDSHLNFKLCPKDKAISDQRAIFNHNLDSRQKINVQIPENLSGHELVLSRAEAESKLDCKDQTTFLSNQEIDLGSSLPIVATGEFNLAPRLDLAGLDSTNDTKAWELEFTVKEPNFSFEHVSTRALVEIELAQGQETQRKILQENGLCLNGVLVKPFSKSPMYNQNSVIFETNEGTQNVSLPNNSDCDSPAIATSLSLQKNHRNKLYLDSENPSKLLKSISMAVPRDSGFSVLGSGQREVCVDNQFKAPDGREISLAVGSYNLKLVNQGEDCQTSNNPILQIQIEKDKFYYLRAREAELTGVIASKSTSSAVSSSSSLTNSSKQLPSSSVPTTNKSNSSDSLNPILITTRKAIRTGAGI